MQIVATFRFAACVVVFFACESAALAQQDYAEAIALYKSRNYAAASDHFARAWRSNPDNTSAGYYAAYCLYLMGKRDAAIASFWKLADLEPERKESIMAREILAKIDPDFSKHVTTAQPKSLVNSSALLASGNLNAGDMINHLVQVIPPKGKLPAVTPAFQQRVKQVLSTVPAPILSYLLASDAHVSLMPSVIEEDFRIQNTTPRGWNDFATWKDSPALTRGKVVVVSEYRIDPKTGEYVDTTASDEIGVVRHELGHALDYCMDYPSQSEDFKHAYLLDSANVPEESRSKLDYFLQKGKGGPAETFAELCCYKFGGETGTRKESCELVHRYFSLTRVQLEKCLKEIGAANH